MVIKLYENLQLLFGINVIEFDLTGEKYSLSEPHFSNGKIVRSEKFCCYIFVKFLESAYIDLIHTVTKFRQNRFYIDIYIYIIYLQNPIRTSSKFQCKVQK